MTIFVPGRAAAAGRGRRALMAGVVTAGVLAAAGFAGTGLAHASVAGAWSGVAPESAAPVCAAAGPEYYAFPLVTTKNIPGTGLGRGTAEVSVAPASPFAVDLAPDGSYRYRVEVSLERMKVPARGRLVAWVATTELDEVRRMGALDTRLRAGGAVAWNKFIVIVTLEPGDDPDQARWSGPVVFRGMSRSGMMHTMVGHGALQQENCAAYGY